LHVGGIFPSFEPGFAVTTIDVRFHKKWVRRALQTSELLTAFEIPSATQSSFSPDFFAWVCDLLLNLAPLGVLILLLSLLIPFQGRIFAGKVFSF
jgi:hypothetical protein